MSARGPLTSRGLPRWVHRLLPPLRFAARETALRYGAGPSYGLPGQSATGVNRGADQPAAKKMRISTGVHILGGCNRFKHDLKAYLAHLGPDAPMKSLDDILASNKFHPSIEKALLASQAASDLPPDQNPKCQEVAENERRLAQGVLKTMDDAKLDVVVYPSWNFPPRLIGDLNTPHGNNSPRVAPPTGFPAITVPMGFARATLPAGIQILGRPWSESSLFRIAYSYEQATQHRRSPAATPPVP
jgi:amidase